MPHARSTWLWAIASFTMVSIIGVGASFWTTHIRREHLEELVAVSAAECHRLLLGHEALNDNRVRMTLGMHFCVRNENPFENYVLTDIGVKEGGFLEAPGGEQEDARPAPLDIKLLSDGRGVTLKSEEGIVVASEITLYPEPTAALGPNDSGFLTGRLRLKVSGYWLEKSIKVHCGSALDEEEWRRYVLTGSECAEKVPPEHDLAVGLAGHQQVPGDDDNAPDAVDGGSRDAAGAP